MTAVLAATAASRLIDKLEHVKANGQNKWLARCPAHDDHNPSLQVTDVGGRTLVHCFAGCRTDDVVTSLGLGMRDLFDSPKELEYRYDNGRTAKRYYTPDGSKKFSQTKTDIAPELYRKTRVVQAVAAGRDVYICEGEEDVRALESLGVTATTAPQGAANWDKVDYSSLVGTSDVYVCADLDKPGLTRGHALAQHLTHIGANVAGILTSATGNDMGDHVAAGRALSELRLVDSSDGSDSLDSSIQSRSGSARDSSDASDGFDGSHLRGTLDAVRAWLGRFVSVTDELDLDLLTLWAAHTHVALETYSTPRLVLDSTMPGSGKTTVLEHLQRLSFAPVQAASLSSPALLARMLSKGIRTILIDEVDRSLDPKKPGVEDLIAILNSGYKRGATRPVLVPGKGGEWDVAEMSTYAPVAMAGNAPHLPDDTRSRSIRVLLMPDLHGRVESSDWEEIEEDAEQLAGDLAQHMEGAREFIRSTRPPLPDKCIGRLKEKWNPLKRVAAAAGGDWPAITDQLIVRDIQETEMDREDGLMKLPPALVLLTDAHAVWPEQQAFMQSSELVSRLVMHNPEYWDQMSAYGRKLTVQRMGRLLVQGFKIHSSKNEKDMRGYQRAQFAKAFRQFNIAPPLEPSKPSEPSELSDV